VGATGPITWTHPGDIQVGPDNLLYVLNNGPDNAALWAFGADGQLVRAIPLATSTPARRGLHIAKDGSIYVADTVGGTIFKYPPTGGVPIASWHGSESILNNPSGLWVGDDNAVFTTESFERVQQLDAKGTLLHRYDTGCAPLYFAQSPKTPDWLDLVCSRGVRSIHLPDSLLQRARSGGGNQPALASPLALAYAPDGRLYLFDAVTVVEYTVTH
jgi:DNA-binding beta-propeller fold protein YncE